MYIQCQDCGKDVFRITLDKRAVCVECGKSFQICVERVPFKPEPPEPLPPEKPEKYWFK